MPLRRKARLPVMRRSAIEGGKAPIAALALQCAISLCAAGEK